MRSLLDALATLGRHRIYRWFIAICAVPALINVPLALFLTHWMDAWDSFSWLLTAAMVFALSSALDHQPAPVTVVNTVSFRDEEAFRREQVRHARRMRGGGHV
ncbi:hypothetical protein SEA_KUWABARA_65 [Gordonia phage Kuwabara]|nr:hypothetical protein SEA_KUWABARA_65 [Gordonia phage Kuwabara]